MAKIKTITEEFEYNTDGVLIKKIITVVEQEYGENPFPISYPNYPLITWTANL